MDIRWNKHIVILYEKGRDEEVASALKYCLEKELNPCDVVTVDSTSYTNVLLRRSKEAAHRFCVKYARKLLSAYCSRREKRAIAHIREESKEKRASLDKKESKNSELTRMINVFKRFDPVMVICTTPYSLSTALRAQRILSVPTTIVGVVTDFALDPAFVQLSADGYFVENPEVRQKLIHFGVEPERVVVIGMPSLKADNSFTLEERRRALGINNALPIVVVDGGIYGTDTIRADVELLMRNNKDFNLIIVTANKKTRRYYMDLPFFTAEVLLKEKLDESILDVATVLVTVPNSKTVFAAFMRGVSVVVARPVTVLEHDVRRYLVKRALVIPSRTPEETLFAVDEILSDNTREEEFRSRGETYAAMSLRDMNNLAPKIVGTSTLRLKNGSKDS